MEREGHDAIAYDAVGHTNWGFEPDSPKDSFSFIPMWVADMNFPTCPAITEAIIKRAGHPAFGYFSPSDAYYDAIMWWRSGGNGGPRVHQDLKREMIHYENGVHGFLTSAVRSLTKEGDPILLSSPVYVGFRSDVEGQGRVPVYSPLRRDEKGIWRMDYEDMETRIRERQIRTVLFCSPHNPTGRVWEIEELQKAMAIFEKYDCLVISDEIWADLVFHGHQHIPLQCVSPWAREHVLAAYAPSKTFNLAGLIGSYSIIYNETIRKKVNEWGEKTNYNEMNVLSMHALIAGCSPVGAEWLSELLTVLKDNAAFTSSFVNDCLPGVSCAMSQGTYMLFLDLAEYLNATGRSQKEVLKAGWDVGVGWQDGQYFMGPSHIRLNLASPRSRIEEAMQRLKSHVFV